MHEAVGRTDEGDVRQRRVLELVADAHERPAWIERAAQQLEQRGALLEHLEQPAIGVELLGANVVE